MRGSCNNCGGCCVGVLKQYSTVQYSTLLSASGRARSLAGWLLSDFIFSKPVLRKWRFFSILFSKKNEMHAWHFYYYSVRIVIKASSNVRWKHPFVRSVRSVISGKICSDRNGSFRSVRSDSSYHILSSISPSMIRISEISTVKMTGRTCTFVFQNSATFGRVSPWFGCRRSKKSHGQFLSVKFCQFPRF